MSFFVRENKWGKMEVISAKNTKKILVVDDEKMSAFLLGRLLRMKGYETQVAYNAFEALDKIEKEEYDLIISDIRMPGKSGLEMIREVKEKYGLHSPKFLVVTGIAFDITKDEMKRLKILQILEKPFPRLRILYKLVENAIYGCPA